MFFALVKFLFVCLFLSRKFNSPIILFFFECYYHILLVILNFLLFQFFIFSLLQTVNCDCKLSSIFFLQTETATETFFQLPSSSFFYSPLRGAVRQLTDRGASPLKNTSPAYNFFQKSQCRNLL